VQLQDASNFFQLPVEITDTSNIDGGTALTLDVYSSNQYKRSEETGVAEKSRMWMTAAPGFLISVA
jgi:hypothetical protein